MKKYFAPHMRCALTSTITTDELLANAGTAGAPKNPAAVGGARRAQAKIRAYHFWKREQPQVQTTQGDIQL